MWHKLAILPATAIRTPASTTKETASDTSIVIRPTTRYKVVVVVVTVMVIVLLVVMVSLVLVAEDDEVLVAEVVVAEELVVEVVVQVNVLVRAAGRGALITSNLRTSLPNDVSNSRWKAMVNSSIEAEVMATIILSPMASKPAEGGILIT